jgi:hypothetical protein
VAHGAGIGQRRDAGENARRRVGDVPEPDRGKVPGQGSTNSARAAAGGLRSRASMTGGLEQRVDVRVHGSMSIEAEIGARGPQPGQVRAERGVGAPRNRR